MTIKNLVILSALLLLGAAAPRIERGLPRPGKDFALFIAVNDYQHWSKLHHPISEVERIAQELEQNYGFETKILRNPTQEQIINALREYNAKAYASDAQLLLYLSGHGTFDDLTKEGFFIPREGRLNDAAQTSYLSFSRLQRIVENISCPHILLAIDACYSGTFDQLVALRGEGDIQFGRPGARESERDRFISRELTLRSRYFIASGKKEQTPDASNFASYFLRALREGGRDFGILTMPELVAELQKAQPKPHIATFAGHQDESNFLFIKTNFIPSKTVTTPSTTSSSPPNANPGPPVSNLPQQQPCVANQTGDVCVQNGRKRNIWVKIDGQVRQVPPGQKECFFDVKAGTLTFTVTTYQPGGLSYTLGGATTHQARITACGTANTVIR